MDEGLRKRSEAWDAGKRMIDSARFNGELPVSPWEALLIAVRQNAYRSAWVGQRINEELAREREFLESDYAQALSPGELEEERQRLGSHIRKWLDQARNEQAQMRTVAKQAIDAGLAERYVQSLQVEAKMIAELLDRTLQAAELTPEQEAKAKAVLREGLQEAAVEMRTRHASTDLPRREIEA